MDKKKVKELMSKAKEHLLAYQRNNKNSDLAMVFLNLQNAERELNKSDWVSVEDELPEYNEMVLVCNQESPNFVKESFRVKSADVPRSKRKNLDSNEFISFTPNHGITHWKPIEKLEE